jgi:cysteine desulfurase
MEIYLDYNATAPLMPAARAAVVAGLDLLNASSVHWAGRAARSTVTAARGQVAAYLGVRPAQIVFTSGGTEALVTALRGATAKDYVVSATEHDAVRATVPQAKIISVTSEGVIDLENLDHHLRQATMPALVAVQFVNNETGVIQPITEVIKLCRQYGALLLCDAVQAVGRMALDDVRGADMVVISTHKMGGPKGAAALVLREGLSITPLITGGGQEERRRAGTENIAAITGFGAAIEHVSDSLNAMPQLATWRDAMEKEISSASPQVKIFSAAAPRIANTSMLALPGAPASTQLMNLDLAGIAVSSGSACSSGKVTPSHVVSAMGYAPDIASAAIRVSGGWATRAEDFQAFTKSYIEMAKRLA